MADVANVAEIEEIAARVAKQVITEVTEQIDKAIAEQNRHLAAIAATIRVATATVTAAVEAIDVAERPPTTQPHRPPAVDDACHANAADGAVRVQVDVYGHLVTEFVQPGSDPAAIWDAMCASVAARAAGAGAWNN